jgi:hypothetical protein
VSYTNTLTRRSSSRPATRRTRRRLTTRRITSSPWSWAGIPRTPGISGPNGGERLGTRSTHLGPFPAHLVGANAKDKTENALHAEVCHGTLTLRKAQFIIATDWFKYYRDKVLK